MGNDPCAAKCFHLSQSELAHTTIQTEVTILKKLQHRHIIQFYQTYEHNDRVYLIMDLAELGSLARAIDSRRPELSDWTTKRRLANEIARGLEHIHLHHILHRDLKSANVLLTKHWEVKLADFGLAEVKTATISKTSALTATEGSPAAAPGTLRWMAPEILNLANPRYTNKSDIYALGMVMWEIAAQCTCPYRSHTDNSFIVGEVIRGEREVLPNDTPDDYQDWVKKCWDGDFTLRPEAKDVILIDGSSENTMNEVDQDAPFLSGLASSCALGSRAEQGEVKAQMRLAKMYQDGGAGVEQSPSDAFRWYLMAANNGEGDAEAQFQLGKMERQGYPEAPQGRVDEAFAWFLRSAERNHAAAQYEVGLMYLRGIVGVERNVADGIRWCHRAADQGRLEAILFLAQSYEDGSYVDQNSAEAASWYHKVAELDSAECVARLALAKMYDCGQGVEQSDEAAARWYLEAADNGSSEAQFKVGTMCKEGRGVEQSVQAAITWWKKAASGGSVDALYLLGMMHKTGDGVSQNDKEAARYLLQAATNNTDAQYWLGTMYQNGQGVEKSGTQASTWLRRAAKFNHAEAQLSLGRTAEIGQDVKQSYREAMTWYRKAVQNKNVRAVYRIGRMHETGRGVPQSDTEATDWYRKAADAGDPDAQFALGEKSYMGRGLDQSYTDAVAWYRKAAENGHAKALLTLGRMYADGDSIPQDEAEAAYWFRQAAEQGDPEAQLRLAEMCREGRGVAQSDIEAVHWFHRAAENESMEAQFALGSMYLDGRGVAEQDMDEAMWWFSRASDQGHPEATTTYDELFARDYGGTNGEDFEYIQQQRTLAEQGLPNAQVCLAKAYLEGIRVKANDHKAFKWFYKAAKQGNVVSKYNLRQMYNEGRGIKELEKEVEPLIAQVNSSYDILHEETE
ncbi:hypothetical protein DFQ27_005539 [Actinomortierella ambigua]|uniref:Protein kinase domain-containing protein n=1 Tax=Actinomortierella ambigua TaxID=1343610 RepID=A0A9P6PZZ8_9FUNG|nr:hypothetical protein DFQ27_005539 [Actinomortierella ambigua]